MSAAPSPSRRQRCWKLAEWPETDRRAWARGLEPGDPFEGGGYGHRLRQGTRDKTIKGYGRWLDFLASRRDFDPSEAPFDRATRPRLRAYFRTLRRAGNADRTVLGRFAELTTAMKVMAPGEDATLIGRPDGVSIFVLLRKARRTLVVPDAGVLYDWGIAMMQGAAARERENWRLAAYRDGLLIAMLAARGRRLRSMALLRNGHEVILRDGGYRIELRPDQVKTNRADRFALPDALVPFIRHYLAVVRPALLVGRREDAFWINVRGRPWGASGIQGQIFRLTKARFGVAFGPHRFRHAIATTAALRVPGHPSLAAEMLGSTGLNMERNYNRADQIQAGTRHMQLLEQLTLGSKGRVKGRSS